MTKLPPQDPHAAPDSLLQRLEHALIAGRLNRRGFMRAVTAAGLATTGLSALADELDAIRANQAERAAKPQAAYDYIVIGSVLKLTEGEAEEPLVFYRSNYRQLD